MKRNVLWMAFCFLSILMLAAFDNGYEVYATTGSGTGADQSTVQGAGTKQGPQGAQLPLFFEANKGQVEEPVRFVSRGKGYGLFLTPGEAVLVLRKMTKGEKAESASHGVGSYASLFKDEDKHIQSFVVRMKLSGAGASSKLVGEEKQPGTSNYLKGNISGHWIRGAGHYGKVRYEEVYPGIDLIFYGNQRQLEYDFVVRPGRDPGIIEMEFQGPESLKLNGSGDLVLRTGAGQVVFNAPIIYQEIGGNRKPVPGHFVLKGANRVGFQVAKYDASRTLIIDPVLSYSTYLGGSGFDQSAGIVVDSAGNSYVAGYTSSLDFPVTTGLTQGGSFDGFVAKLNPAGDTLIYSTFLGGTGLDSINALALDSSGNVFVTGATNSPDFPVTAGSYQSSLAGDSDAFVAKLNSTGDGLVYSTLLGGEAYEEAFAMAVDAAGNAFVTGGTASFGFPSTAGAFQTGIPGFSNTFVTKLNPGGSGLVYSTFLGGTDFGQANGIALDGAGNAYVAGETDSLDFPVTAGAYQTTKATSTDAFVTKLNPAGTGLVYSTFLGDTGFDQAFGIAVDAAGNAHVAGQTNSTLFPVTASAFQTTFAGGIDGFVAQLDSLGGGLVYSTLLGGNGFDQIRRIALDSLGNAWVQGFTNSGAFPTTADAFQAVPAGGNDSFLSQLNSSGDGLVYSTFMGGEGSDQGGGIFVDGGGDVYVTGMTNSTTFPVTPGVVQGANAGGFDVFAAKFASDAGPAGDPVDEEPPVLVVPPDRTVEATGPMTSVDIGVATATDNVSLESEIVITHDAPATFPLETTLVTWTATDAAGNATARIQKITVEDTTPPEVSAPPDITVTANGSLTPVDLGTAVANDLVDGPLEATPDITGPFVTGTHTIAWSATDAAGNTGTATQNVQVGFLFSGFQSPVLNAPAVNLVKAGRKIRVKWSLYDGNGGYLNSMDAIKSLEVQRLACDPATVSPEYPLENAVSKKSRLRYHKRKGQFVFKWKTRKKMKNQCFQLVLTLADNSRHVALFKFKGKREHDHHSHGEKREKLKRSAGWHAKHDEDDRD